MLLTFYFTKTSMIDIFDLKYRFVPTQTQTTFCCSVTQSCLALSTPRTAACQASLSFTISWSFLKLMSIESVMPSSHLILYDPLLLLLSVFSSIRAFSNEPALRIRCPRYWSCTRHCSSRKSLQSNETYALKGEIDSVCFKNY